MSGRTNTVRATPRALHRTATIEGILDVAWAIVREEGLAALSLRDLGARVGMRAQSLYSYFPSKHAIYDAMFRQGYEQFLREAVPGEGGAVPADWTGEALAHALSFFDFCTADPVRYQLLFQRSIPGFVPSDDSMALAIRSYDETVGRLLRFGVTDQAGLDMWTAVLSGLVSQQVANDPGGSRWRSLVAPAVLMLQSATTHTKGATP